VDERRRYAEERIRCSSPDVGYPKWIFVGVALFTEQLRKAWICYKFDNILFFFMLSFLKIFLKVFFLFIVFSLLLLNFSNH